MEGLKSKQINPLERSFHQPKFLDIAGTELEVVDIQPETLKTDVPTLIIPGFSATPKALKDSILRTAEAGRRVLSPNEPHGISVSERQSDLPEAEEWQGS